MSTSRFWMTPAPHTPLSTQDYSPLAAHSTSLASLTAPHYFTTSSGRSSTRKRLYCDEEGNENCQPNSEHTPPNLLKKQRYTPRRNDSEKLREVLKAIKGTGWTLGEFLYHVFRTKYKSGEVIHRDKSHAHYVSHFLQGDSEYTPAIILEAWYKHPDGRISTDSPSQKLMYSISPSYTEICNVRAMLTSFAVQIIGEKLVKEARVAVLPSSGLHASAKKKSSLLMMD